MNNKLTYKIGEILIDNDYVEVKIKNKKQIDEANIEYACIKFKYIAKEDKGYLTIGTSKENTLFEIDEDDIEDVTIDNDSVTVDTENKTYYFYKEIQMIP